MDKQPTPLTDALRMEHIDAEPGERDMHEETYQLAERMERDRTMLREALSNLREHFLWRYMRTKKEGRDYDVPAQVLAADDALAATEDKHG